jgi:hypothetical protein
MRELLSQNPRGDMQDTYIAITNFIGVLIVVGCIIIMLRVFTIKNKK